MSWRIIQFSPNPQNGLHRLKTVWGIVEWFHRHSGELLTCLEYFSRLTMRIATGFVVWRLFPIPLVSCRHVARVFWNCGTLRRVRSSEKSKDTRPLSIHSQPTDNSFSQHQSISSILYYYILYCIIVRILYYNALWTKAFCHIGHHFQKPSVTDCQN